MVPVLKSSGIYRIVVQRGDLPAKFYIGQAVNFRERHYAHFGKLRRGSHGNMALQRAFNLRGESAFRFEPLLICSRDTLQGYEQSVLDAYIGWYGPKSVYNICKECVSVRLGVRSSAETRANISKALKGRTLRPEQIERMRLARLGRCLTPEAIAKRTAKQRGRIVSPETRAKHAAAMLGHRQSDETRAKISAAKKGWTPPQDHVERLRTMNLGRKHSPEHVEKLAAQRRGKPRDPDVLAKAWATRRAKKADLLEWSHSKGAPL